MSKSILVMRALLTSLRLGFALGLALALALCASAQAQTPPNPYAYSRTSAFSYQANGLLASETIEPDQPALCLTTTYGYDAYGNKNSASSANCTGAVGLAQITPRASSSTYLAQTGRIGKFDGPAAPVPAGTFATGVLNAADHSETRTYDPRFGAVVELIGPNTLPTRWQLDDFGRKVLEVRADGTRTAMYYCWLSVTFNNAVISTDSNSPGCHNGSVPSLQVPAPVAGEAPADAARYEHSVAQNTAGAQISAFARIYYDRAGRKIRSVTQAFDGTTQPVSTNRLIVQDTDYNPYGAAIVATQPYFLDSGSSTTGGASNAGMTLTEYDALGRVVNVYNTDPASGSGGTPGGTTSGTPGGTAGGSQASVAFGGRGTRQASKTSIAYAGLATITTDDKNHTRLEEKNPDGRVVRVTDASGVNPASGAQLVHQHDAFGNLVATKDALGNLVQISYDIRARKVSLNDPDAGVTVYCYDVLGQLKAQQTSNQRGSHTAQACPNISGAGSLAPSVTGWTTLAYDKLGRMTQRIEPEYITNWAYDSCGTGVGKLCQTSTSNGITRKLVYDSLGRPVNTRTDVSNGPSLASAVAYDANGRVATQTWPTGVQVSYEYTARGYLSVVKLDTTATIAPLPATPGGAPAAGTTLSAGTVLWSAVAVNAWGKAEQHAYANGINNRAVFEPQSGRLTNLTAGPGATVATSTVVDQRYAWDSTNLLTRRVDALGDSGVGGVGGGGGAEVLDTFGYDPLGRLTQYQVSGSGGTRTVSLRYNALGMLLAKSDVGNYSYPAQGVANGRPHAVQAISGSVSGNITGSATSYTYDLNGNAVAASAGKWRSIAYTSFNLPDGTNGIQGPAGSLGSPGIPKATWQYDESHQRIREDRLDAQGTRTTWYFHPDNQGGLAFEREIAPNGAQSNRHYFSAGGSAFAVLVTTGALPTLGASQTAPAFIASVSAVKLEFWHKDQLGSLIATTDHAGSVTARYAYDPFGKRRYTNSTYDTFGSLIVDWTTDTNNGTDRGFTGHEHLDDLGLVHMNGRVFEPTIARFLQADPFIQDPTNLQNFDRYGYCFNSPMGCTDPSGLCFMGCFWQPMKQLNAIVRLAYEISGLKLLGVSFSDYRVVSSIVFTVVSGVPATIFEAAVSGFFAGAIATGNTKGALQGAFSAAVFFGVGNLNEGGNFFTGGGTQGALEYGKIGAVAMHGVAGCVTSVAGGGKCGTGVLSAAFSETATVSGLQFKGATGIISAAVIGGTASVLGGGKFANGAQTAAFGYLFNHLLHKDSVRSLFGGARGHHPFAQQWANEYRELISPDALAVLSGSTIGGNVVWEGDHPNKWGAEHKAYNDYGGRKIVDDFFAERGVTSTNQLDVKQSYELVDRLKQHDFNVKMQQYVDYQQSRGRFNMNRVFRPRGGTGQPGD